MVFVGRDKAHVRASIEPSLRNYFDVVGSIIEPESTAPEHQAAFQAIRERLKNIDYPTVDSIMEFSAMRNIASIGSRVERTIQVLAPGLLVRNRRLERHQNVVDSMRLFAERVMPKFQ